MEGGVEGDERGLGPEHRLLLTCPNPNESNSAVEVSFQVSWWWWLGRRGGAGGAGGGDDGGGGGGVFVVCASCFLCV